MTYQLLNKHVAYTFPRGPRYAHPCSYRATATASAERKGVRGVSHRCPQSPLHVHWLFCLLDYWEMCFSNKKTILRNKLNLIICSLCSKKDCVSHVCARERGGSGRAFLSTVHGASRRYSSSYRGVNRYTIAAVLLLFVNPLLLILIIGLHCKLINYFCSHGINDVNLFSC